MLKKPGTPPLTVSPHFKLHGWLYVAEKLVVPHASAFVMTLIAKGQRNMMPECRPVPRPMEEWTPRTSHQAASYT